MNVILCGCKSCGKTFFGQRVAKKYQVPFIDTDQVIEESEGASIQEIVEDRGEPYFRQLEEMVISDLNCRGHLIAVGGGAILQERCFSHLKSLGTVLFLNAPKELIKQRMLSPPLPTYIDPDDVEASFERNYSTRIMACEKIADGIIHIQGKTNEQITEEIWQAINLETSSK